MKDDPIVNEIRSIRREIERKYGNTPAAYYNHLLAVQQEIADRVVAPKQRKMTLAEDAEYYEVRSLNK